MENLSLSSVFSDFCKQNQKIIIIEICSSQTVDSACAKYAIIRSIEQEQNAYNNSRAKLTQFCRFSLYKRLLTKLHSNQLFELFWNISFY